MSACRSDRQAGPDRELTGLVAAALGLALFAWFVRRSRRRRRSGTGSRRSAGASSPSSRSPALRFALRAMAWSLCLEPPRRLPFRTGVRRRARRRRARQPHAARPDRQRAGQGRASCASRVPLGPALTALAIENILYTLSVAAMIAASTMALLLSFELPPTMRRAAWIAVAIAIAVGVRRPSRGCSGGGRRSSAARCRRSLPAEPHAAIADRAAPRSRGADLHVRAPRGAARCCRSSPRS